MEHDTNAADYGEWKFGRRITGLSYSGNLFALKMGMAVAGAAVGFSLGLFGYQAGATAQTPLATMGICGAVNPRSITILTCSCGGWRVSISWMTK
ncbi:MFS transporter [Klebsiella pneumoniae subsp. pneumoniae]|nr:MFS transporter [Klebsiella pneumoniae subsp. pneumoniae]